MADGLNLKDLASVLEKLSKCLGKDANKFTLTEIENTSYSPVLETDDTEVVSNFNEIHKAISNTELERLPKDYQDYANTLNKILFVNGLYLTTHNSIDESSTKLTSLTKLESNQFYYSITTLSGKLISLYGKNEAKPSIAIRISNGEEFTIHVTPSQEKEVSEFYKGLNLRLRVRLKKDIKNGNVITASLIDYTIPTDLTFLQSIERVQLQYGEIFQNINDSAKHLNEIRNQ
ncbi:MAG: hypothetical protein ACXVA2_22970 [Mucilaginibacter sp.]